MNDCLWGWIDECKSEICQCEEYLSVNEPTVNAKLKEYSNKVNEMFEPILKEIKKVVKKDMNLIKRSD